MKNSRSGSGNVQGPYRSVLRLTPLALACSTLLMPVGAAFAQQAAPAQPQPAIESSAPASADASAEDKKKKTEAAAQETPVELGEVVVSGLRGSIESSIAVKKDSNSIVEVVTAEDIGKLPNVSIAESIATLPGLTAQRVGGRAQVISIRGLGPDFAVTLFNGRELVSSGDNRGVEYDQFPSELINRVIVYKTPDATLAAQGLSGTVDLQTLHPLDIPKRLMSVNLRGEYNSNGVLNDGTSDKGNRLSFAYADKYRDDTIGLAISYAHLNSPLQEQRFNTWGYDNDNGLPPGNEDVYKIGGGEVYAKSSDQQRDSVLAVLEFQPNADLHSELDLYYSQFSQDQSTRAMLFSVGPSWDGTAILDPVIESIPGSNLRQITGGTLTGVNPVYQSNYDTRDDKMYALGWNTSLQRDKWTLDADLSYSKVNRKDQPLEAYAGGPTENNLAFSIPFGNDFPTFTPSFDYADPNLVKLSDPGFWGQDAFMRKTQIDDELGSLRFSAKRELDGPFTDFVIGLNYSSRQKTNTAADFQYFLKNDRAPATVDSDLLLRPTSLGFAGVPGLLTYDMLGALARYYEQGTNPDPQGNLYQRNYSVSEKVTTLFGQLDIDSNLGSVPVRGNLGLQAVRTDQSSIGHDAADPLAPIEKGTTYTEWLPNLNLNFDLNEYSKDMYIRFGAARTMARARMDDLRYSRSGGVGVDHMWSGDSGNPELRPWIANAYDLSAEKYFNKSSYLVLAVFYKDLKNYIYTSEQLIDFEAAGFINNTGIVPLSPIGVVSTPTNGVGGVVKGVELSGSFAGSLLSESLDGFGLLGSVSETKSSIDSMGPGSSQSLPGMSGTVYNVEFFYEKYGFTARIGEHYRSAFRAESLGAHGLQVSTEIKSERLADLQLSYAFQSGKLEGLTFLVQVNNLMDTPYRTRYIGNINGTLDGVAEYQSYGRQTLFGITYDF